MAIHVDEMVSSVFAEPDAQAPGSSETTDWSELQRIREAYARLKCDRRRAAAEGYDD